MATSIDDRVTTVMIRVPTEKQIREIMGLYRAEGWWQAEDDGSPQLIARLIAGSHCFTVALAGNDVVGMGRAISDRISDAYIQDVTVRSDYRNQGIGRRIVQTLLEHLHADGLHWIGLIAKPGSVGLYRWAGFQEMSGCLPMLINENP
jgi:aralkylamine N-acetyltransferase